MQDFAPQANTRIVRLTFALSKQTPSTPLGLRSSLPGTETSQEAPKMRARGWCALAGCCLRPNAPARPSHCGSAQGRRARPRGRTPLCPPADAQRPRRHRRPPPVAWPASAKKIWACRATMRTADREASIGCVCAVSGMPPPQPGPECQSASGGVRSHRPKCVLRKTYCRTRRRVMAVLALP